jgi:hypothetical protein
MSCLPWGYANKVIPAFVPATGDNLLVLGNGLVNGGRLTVGNNLYDPFNERGSFFQMTPSNPLLPLVSPPLYYYFQANPESQFLLARINTRPPAKDGNSTVLRVSPVNAGVSTTDENIMSINAQITIEGAVISRSIVSGYSGIRYITGFTLGPIENPPSLNYNGATFLLKSNPTGDGGVNIILPSDFFTSNIYVGATIFRFIFPQATTDQVIVISRRDLTFFRACQPNNTTITEGIWNGTTIDIFSYPYIETEQRVSGVRSIPPPVRLDSEPPENLPLADLSQPTV